MVVAPGLSLWRHLLVASLGLPLQLKRRSLLGVSLAPQRHRQEASLVHLHRQRKHRSLLVACLGRLLLRRLQLHLLGVCLDLQRLWPQPSLVQLELGVCRTHGKALASWV